IYYGNPGYLLVSSQGSSDFAVYKRDNNAYVGRFKIDSGAIDGVTHTDGIDVTNRSLGGSYNSGLFVTQDNDNPSGNQNFKLVPWNRIAKYSSPALAVDTAGNVNTGGGATAPSPTATPKPSTRPVTYYVDSAKGSDSNSGTSSSKPWKSLTKVNSIKLPAGSRVLLHRGSSWTGSLKISSSGASGNTTLIGAYGAGNAPVIKNGSSCVTLSGSYLVLQDLKLVGCSWAGVQISGSHNLIRRNVISDNVVGVVIKSGAGRNRVVSNVIADNNVMQSGTSGSNDDSGAFGVLVQGDFADISYNTISGSDAYSPDYGRDGAAVEIYGGRHNQIHHNLARNNDAFTELGNSRSGYNTYSYNVVFSSLKSSTFLVTRGSGSGYGPVEHTTVYNNTVLLTGSSSQGFVCSSGCSSTILRMRNNIIQAVLKVGYADATFDEDYNLYYGGITQFKLGSHSRVANPRFVDAGNWNVKLTSSSPAIDTGQRNSWTVDYAGSSVPRDGNGDGSARQDMGAYEY
ncbi:MAG TPA: phytase, partial [Thermomicrobiales bacterium]|nr:phytase [Thermomicrobiales bacterium]